jgi:hypothetical protein
MEDPKGEKRSEYDGNALYVVKVKLHGPLKASDKNN